MAKLIAKRPILFNGKMYESGETLPCYNTEYVKAWVKNGAAGWEGKIPEQPEEVKQEQPEEVEEAQTEEKEQKKTTKKK